MICEEFMKKAIDLAVSAAEEGEVPVAALVVKDNEIISTGVNYRQRLSDPISHAETEAIRQAAKKLGWRLNGCDIYVTLEPCPMCAGAIINARISRVFFGAYDSTFGAFGSVTDLSREKFPSRPEVHGGIMEAECKKIMTQFFKKLR